ncbi:glycosyl hydrolase family 16 [Dyadobacter jejuensis]|uniref:Glycosyl hydrolase family 16 n=1 Tax=Dyadobacter jejuensis TaxID=1082580 RepID=A0A316AKH4_9BACT|nr:family 16 glycosylhydrolase [Dyadobacter jejuensis]PWJ58002.1 glycosyl hydrolase family 16 [Dyadobacter jejuensis]
MRNAVIWSILFVGSLGWGFAQPAAPKGYHWVKNGAFSDEFDGDVLDSSKWFDRSPYWKNGRPPADFRASNVSVKDGNLQIKNEVLDPAEGVYNLTGGAVASKSAEASYGYYEVRMKASGVSMSSTFWLKTPTYKEGCKTYKSELDIVEAIGGAKKFAAFKYKMKSNAHLFVTDCDGNKQPTSSTPGETNLVAAVDSVYHVFGCWWKDANTLEFYYNGDYAFTIHPDTTERKTPFDRPMYMHLVTETYSWEVPPTKEELADKTKNVTYYDWVRSYTLAPDDKK